MYNISKGHAIKSVFTIMICVVGGLIMAMAAVQAPALLVLLAPALLLLGMATSFNGMDFNKEKKLYKDYFTPFGVKVGQWKSYEEYCYVSYHTVSIVNTRAVNNMALSFESDPSIEFKVFLLNKEHNKKLMIKYCKGLKETKEVVDEIVKELGVEVKKFNPVHSSRKRRK